MGDLGWTLGEISSWKEWLNIGMDYPVSHHPWGYLRKDWIKHLGHGLVSTEWCSVTGSTQWSQRSFPDYLILRFCDSAMGWLKTLFSSPNSVIWGCERQQWYTETYIKTFWPEQFQWKPLYGNRVQAERNQKWLREKWSSSLLPGSHKLWGY